MLFAGVLPAIILVLLRRGLEEPERFQAVADRRKAIRAQRERSGADRSICGSPRRTHVRAIAVSFSNGSGRIITSFGPLIAGLLVGSLGGSLNRATAVMTCFAGLSIFAALLGRETRGEVLPY